MTTYDRRDPVPGEHKLKDEHQHAHHTQQAPQAGWGPELSQLKELLLNTPLLKDLHFSFYIHPSLAIFEM